MRLSPLVLTFVALAFLSPLVSAGACAQDPYAGTDPATCASMSADGVEVYAYEVQEGDSCTRVAQRAFGERSRYDLIHQYNPAMGPPDHHLAAGTYLCLPRAAPPRGSGPTARITALRQRVNARRPDATAWAQARLGQPLDRGERVSVLSRAFAELTFRDTSIVTLRGDTLVIVHGGEPGARSVASRAELESGALRSRLGELRGGNRLAIEAPSAVIVLSGGAAVTSTDAQATARVSNHEGAAAVVTSRAGGTVRVAPGMGSSVPRGARPTRPQPLPPAPAWTLSPPRHVGVAQLTTVRGEWSAVPNARSYRVEVSRQRDGRELVAALEVPASVSRFEIHRLPPGIYHTRVSTIDGDFFESRPSAPYTFEVVLGRLEVPGQAAPPQFDHGDASEEPTPLTVLPGARFVPPEGVRCTLEGAEDTTLRAPGSTTLACVDAEGRALGVVEVQVAAVELRPADEARELVLARGEEAEVTLRIASAVEVPSSVAVRGSDGLEVLVHRREGETLTVRVRATADAPEEGTLALMNGETALGALPVAVSAAPAVAAVAAPPSSEPSEPDVEDRGEPLFPQPFGTVPWPSMVGLRDIRRDGLNVAIAGTVAGDAAEQRARIAVSARAGLLERQLQLELGTTLDFHRQWERTSHRGAGDVYAAASYAPRFDQLALAFELAAFFPTGASEGGLAVVRLVPSVHLQLALSELIGLRARLGAAADLDGSGNAALVSAYGIDLRVAEPVVLGVELGLSLGQEDGALLTIPTAGASVGLVVGPLIFTGGARFGLSESAWSTMGVWSVVLGAEYAGPVSL